MPVKLKNIPLIERSDPLQKHLNTFLSPSKEKTEYAKKKLEVVGVARDLIKKNSDMPEKVSKPSDPLKTAEAKDKFSVLSAAIDKTAQVNPESQQTIIEYLSQQDKLRKENQLVHGKSFKDPNLNRLGLGIVENQDKSETPFYQRKFSSTHAYSFRGDQYSIQGAVEFGVTYDNRFFIVPKPDGLVVNNLYKMAQGALLKAVGCIQIGNSQVEERVTGGDVYPKVLEGQVNYVSVYNAFFDAPIDNIAVSLFALQHLGIDLSNTQVVIPNDNAPLIKRITDCNIAIQGEIQDAGYYLDETRFPGAKALAEKDLTLLDKIVELFCIIDDEFLALGNKKFLKEIYGEKELLKLNLIQLFSCTEKLIDNTEQKAKVTKIESELPAGIHQPSTSAQALSNQSILSNTTEVKKSDSFNDFWQAIKGLIQFFKEKNVDLSFLTSEINLILAYILHNGLTPAEKNQLQEWSIPGKIIPGRGLDIENISSFIAFDKKDPIQTCINLLKDYTKGQGLSGVIKRFFSLAWNRHYISSVNQFLREYDPENSPDNLTIYDILNKLRNFGADISLRDNKSTLLKRLLFCATLNGEESDFIPVIIDGECLDDAAHQLTLPLENVQPPHGTPIPTQPLWVPAPIAITPPPLPFGNSPTESTELLINRTKAGSYQDTFENKFFPEHNQPIRPRSASEASKRLTTKFFIDAEKGLNPIMLLGEQGKVAGGNACPSSPGVSGL